MNRIIYLIALVMFFVGCSSDGKNIKEGLTDEFKIEHFNIVIAPDLSNRMDVSLKPKPLKDVQIAKIILDNLPSILSSGGRSENQKDIVKLDFINKGLINQYKIKTQNLEINFSKFEKQLDRINYIKGRSELTLDKEVEDFLIEYNSINAAAEKDNFGADIWSYLNGLDESAISNNSSSISFKNVTYINEYRHILLLLTDGYIEGGVFGKDGCINEKECYYLSGNLVNNFRNAFRKSGEQDMKAFFEKSGYGIVPIKNPILKNVEVLALEINDRSLDIAGNATVFPTDYQILELFWTDWMKKSGVKKFKMKSVLNSQSDAQKEIFGFMDIK